MWPCVRCRCRRMTAPRQAGEPALLEAVSLSKSFGPVQVLENINLRVNGGEIHAIIGENGAGKSTLMKILAGNERQTGGEIRIDGKPVSFPARQQQRHEASCWCIRKSCLHQT